MRCLTAIALLTSTALSQGAWSAELPAELVGVWSTPESEFEGEKLIGGTVLYLLANGHAAVVGAPLPVGRCADGRLCTPIIGVGGTATYDVASARLTVSLRDESQTAEAVADYNIREKVLLLRSKPSETVRLIRRSLVVPRALEEKFDGNP